jgi:hypothetical protein
MWLMLYVASVAEPRLTQNGVNKVRPTGPHLVNSILCDQGSDPNFVDAALWPVLGGTRINLGDASSSKKQISDKN